MVFSQLELFHTHFQVAKQSLPSWLAKQRSAGLHSILTHALHMVDI